MNLIVDLPAVRPARLADGADAAELRARLDDLGPWLRGARVEALGDGVRLILRLEVRDIARLAEAVRAEADWLPYWSFRLLAEPPACRLEVTGEGGAGELARAVFAALAA